MIKKFYSNFPKIILILSPLVVIHTVANSLTKSDENSINKVIVSYMKGWNENNADKFSESFSSDAEFVNIFGQRFIGKKAVRDRHEVVLNTFLKNTKLEATQIDLKEIKSSNVVIGHINWKIIEPQNKQDAEKVDSQIKYGIFTQIFVKENGKWLIVASQNTLKKELKSN